MNNFISYEKVLINVDEIMYAEISLETDNLEITMKNGKRFIFDKEVDILNSLERITQAEVQ